MFFVTLIVVGFGLAAALMHDDVVKLLLAMAWAGMALMAAGSTLYALLSLL
jgi:hypothetical protein